MDFPMFSFAGYSFRLNGRPCTCPCFGCDGPKIIRGFSMGLGKRHQQSGRQTDVRQELKGAHGSLGKERFEPPILSDMKSVIRLLSAGQHQAASSADVRSTRCPGGKKPPILQDWRL
ncbi:MAG: hypothetical protein ACI4SY_02585 [Sutterella sp.]